MNSEPSVCATPLSYLSVSNCTSPGMATRPLIASTILAVSPLPHPVHAAQQIAVLNDVEAAAQAPTSPIAHVLLAAPVNVRSRMVLMNVPQNVQISVPMNVLRNVPIGVPKSVSIIVPQMFQRMFS